MSSSNGRIVTVYVRGVANFTYQGSDRWKEMHNQLTLNPKHRQKAEFTACPDQLHAKIIFDLLISKYRVRSYDQFVVARNRLRKAKLTVAIIPFILLKGTQYEYILRKTEPDEAGQVRNRSTGPVTNIGKERYLQAISKSKAESY